MKILAAGHPLSHVRQWKFFETVAGLGHEVLLVSPSEWNGQVPPFKQDSLELKVLPTLAEGVRGFSLLGLTDLVKEFAPAWVYVHGEPESALCHQVAALETPAKKAVFTWQNISRPLDHFAYFAALDHYDLVVCGNDGAETRMKHAGAKRTVVLPQVGVDCDHFQARPDVPRDIPVAYIGRPAPEKGIPQLLQAWPAAKILDWVDYRELPWRYSQAQVLICFSQDTENWREQAMPFISCEAMACGCAVIVSDAGSIPFWHSTYPGPNDPSPAVVVPQGAVETLGRAIRGLLAKPALREELADKGRPWVERNLSSPIIARRLMDAFNY